MHIFIDREYLTQAVGDVSKAVSVRTTLPILTGIKIALTDQECLFAGSDSDISIQSSVPFVKDGKEIVKVVRLGSVVLPAKYLPDIVKKLPDQMVEIEVLNHYVTVIRSGTAEYKLNGLNADEYPRLPQIDAQQSLSLSSDQLKKLIRQTVFAVSTQESRPILTGVLWQLNEGKLTFIATDSHRLAQRQVAVESNQNLNFSNVVIPGKSLNELYRILDDEDEMIDVVVTENQILVKAKHILFYSRLLEGTYPDTSRIIPQQDKTSLTIETKQLLQAIERASLLARDSKHIVHLSSLDNGQIQLTSTTPEVGKVVEYVPVINMDGEMIKISFNAKYVLDALKAIDSPEIRVGFTGAMSPFIIKPTDQGHILHLILPVRDPYSQGN